MTRKRLIHCKTKQPTNQTFLYVQKVLFQTIQFSVSTLFIWIWPIDRTLSGIITPSQSGPGSHGSEEVFCIPQSSSIPGASQSDCLVPYPRHSLGESYFSAEMQSVYSVTPADWVIFCCKLRLKVIINKNTSYTDVRLIKSIHFRLRL